MPLQTVRFFPAHQANMQIQINLPCIKASGTKPCVQVVQNHVCLKKKQSTGLGQHGTAKITAKIKAWNDFSVWKNDVPPGKGCT